MAQASCDDGDFLRGFVVGARVIAMHTARAFDEKVEAMNWEQIRERYPDQWVVIGEIDWPEKPKSLGFRSAVVYGFGGTEAAAIAMAGGHWIDDERKRRGTYGPTVHCACTKILTGVMYGGRVSTASSKCGV